MEELKEIEKKEKKEILRNIRKELKSLSYNQLVNLYVYMGDGCPEKIYYIHY